MEKSLPIKLNQVLAIMWKSDIIIIEICRYSSSAERQLPKLDRWVRLPLSACITYKQRKLATYYLHN